MKYVREICERDEYKIERKNERRKGINE